MCFGSTRDEDGKVPITTGDRISCLPTARFNRPGVSTPVSFAPAATAQNSPLHNPDIPQESVMSELTVEHLSKQFATPSGTVKILENVSFRLAAGENAAVIGPSGSGKSTLLSILGALEPPSAGRVVLAGEEPFRLKARELARFRNKRVGFVFQEHYLLPQCTVLENVLLPTLAAGGPTEDTFARAVMLLERVGLSHRQDHRPAELSGGESQRAALARALIHRPTLILADEPTGNLDREAAERVADLLLELQALESAILVVVTHSKRLADRMQRCWELAGGHLSVSV